MATEKPPSVVLIPARFQQVIPPLLAESPLPYLLGTLWRHRLLHDFVATRSGVSIDSNLATDQYLSVAGASQIALVQGNTIGVQNSAFSLRGKFSIPEIMSCDGRLLVTQEGGLGMELLLRRALAKKIAADIYLRNRILGLRLVGSQAVFGVESEIKSPGFRSDPNLAYATVKFGRLSVGAEISFKNFRVDTVLDSEKPGDFSASFGVSDSGVVLGFQQRLVSRRRVLNPLEDARVRFIANFVDTAFETTYNTNNKTSEFHAAVSLQPNKNLLLKTRLSTVYGIAGTAAFKFWGVPTLALAATVGFRPQGSGGVGQAKSGVSWRSLGGYVGVHLVVQNHGDTEFPRFSDFGKEEPRGYRWEVMREEELDNRLPSKGRYQPATRTAASDLLF